MFDWLSEPKSDTDKSIAAVQFRRPSVFDLYRSDNRFQGVANRITVVGWFRKPIPGSEQIVGNISVIGGKVEVVFFVEFVVNGKAGFDIAVCGQTQ